MIRVTSIVPDIVTNVINPVARQVINKMILDLDVGKYFENKVYLYSDDKGGSLSRADGKIPLLKENRFNANISYNINPYNTKWATTTFTNLISGTDSLQAIQEPRAIFHDFLSQTTLTERETPCSISMECKMSFTDRVSANEALTKLYTLYNDGEMMFMTDLRYEYALPANIINKLFSIHKFINNGTDFIDYLRTYSDEVISLNINKHDRTAAPEIVVKRNASRVLAAIEFGQEKPEAQMTNMSADLYHVSFSVTTQLSRCHMNVLTYPISIYNNLVPNALLNIREEDFEINTDYSVTHFSENQYIRKNKTFDDPTSNVIHVPWYDTWVPNGRSLIERLNYKPFLIHHFTLDDIDNPSGVTSLDLTALAYSLTPTVLNEIVGLGMEVFDFNRRYNITLFTNNFMIEVDTISFNGSIITIPNRNKFAVYRLVISENQEKPYAIDTSLRVINFDIVTKTK